MHQQTEYSTLQLSQQLDQLSAKIIDLRPSAAFNGWPLLQEQRGGHIPGALSFPAEWFNQFSETVCFQTLQSKGLQVNDNIILTGYDPKNLHLAGQKLPELGFTNIAYHREGMLDWLESDTLPVNRLTRFQHLVHPEWLKQVLQSRQPGDNFVLAHVNFDNWGDYDAGHIAGAIWLDTLALEDESTWNHRSPAELEAELCAHGIAADTTVVLYGRTSDPNMSQEQPGQQAGQLASMRAALLLMYAGVKQVQVLDGGLEAWQRAGGSITRQEYLAHPLPSTSLKIPEHPDYITLIAAAKEYLADQDSELVSVRSWEEFIGEVSGYHYIEQKGRIPGAVFGNCGSDAYHMENYRNPDDTLRPAEEITAMLAAAGLTAEKRIAFYCGTGWRASEAWFSTWLMGWPQVSIFDGGWFEWSNDPDNPFETGVPE